jgi:uncharacterized protein YbcC (UPF0753/DUF2309 family)
MRTHIHDEGDLATTAFDEEAALHHLHHHLPAQAPLKDFIHHNTLHAFQSQPFHEGIAAASAIFGYRVSPDLETYRQWHSVGKIPDIYLNAVLIRKKGEAQCMEWRELLLRKSFSKPDAPRIGRLRSHWKKHYKIDLDALVHPLLFRTLCSYLDQGIASWCFPITDDSFLDALRKLNQQSGIKIIQGKRAQQLLQRTDLGIADLLKELVGQEEYYHDYLFDLCFAHQGWSGMVSAVEQLPHTLLDQRKITLRHAILFELLLEIDALDREFGPIWAPLGQHVSTPHTPLFARTSFTQYREVISLWQEALEWSFHDPLVVALKESPLAPKDVQPTTQAILCIDDRECSLRRHLENGEGRFETFGTPGFFGVAFYFKPLNGKFMTKLCPAPVTPIHLIKELGSGTGTESDLHFSRHSHHPLTGVVITQLVGFWSALKLLFSLFFPEISANTSSAAHHMHADAQLTIERDASHPMEDGLFVGYTVAEMCDSVERFLKSIGLTERYGQLIYIVGHGSSSTNNPHFAAYDCGACSGRAGSVNARAMAYMANHSEVRKHLQNVGIHIPSATRFVGALHDTTRDEMHYYDIQSLPIELQEQHHRNAQAFCAALDANAKERSRRFASINTAAAAAKVHQQVALRSVSLFEPRPELNHATNAACIVGRRTLSKNVFLDRRSFLNSYDYRVDAEGTYLHAILRAVAPVCGGINLEYYFSRVDNQKLGAGSKLPHNVMGLIGVANGIDGDLRPGLPSQMIEVHDPVRLLVVVEHFPNIVQTAIARDAATFEWFQNEWVRLVAIDPTNHATHLLVGGRFEPYSPLEVALPRIQNVMPIIERAEENIPIQILETL